MAAFLFGRSTDLPWPQGDSGNSSDTILSGVHFNLSTLQFFNYTLYGNETLSNGSSCYMNTPKLIADYLYENGSFVNSTSCYKAIDPIGTRGITGIAMCAAFGVALVLSLTTLAKHGKLYIPKDSRFYPIGRRWQWYWAFFVCGCAFAGLILNVDVDRYRVQELPIIVTTFFYYLMSLGTVCVVWEAVRHWGSWLERQYVDPNPFILPDDDRRSKIEFYLPLWFYLIAWMNFFMIIPRNWTFAYKQNDPEQMATEAEPSATGPRFKAGAFLLFVCWLTICFSMWHSIKHYKPRNRGFFNRSIGLVRAIPLRFLLIIPLCLGVVGYQALISFQFQYSVVKADGPVPIIYGWGYGCPLLILFIQILYGWASPNEDKELIRLRRERGQASDRELGITRKPAWWSRVRGDHIVGSFRDRLLKNVQEIGPTQGTGRREEGEMERHIRENMRDEARDEDGDIELPNLRKNEYNPREDRAGVSNIRRKSAVGPDGEERLDRATTDRVINLASNILFPNPEEVEKRDREAELERARRIAYLQEDGPAPPSYSEQQRSRRTSNGTLNSVNAPPTQVRSMLDL